MNSDLFREVVSLDVRGRLDGARRSELRRPELRARWAKALQELADDVDQQLETPGGTDTWRSKVIAFRRTLSRRLTEARHPAVVVGDPQARVRQLERLITEHRDHRCDESCDESCPADEALWAALTEDR